MRYEAKIETSLPGMNPQSKKLTPVQGIILAFLLLLIPIGTFFLSQTGNITRFLPEAAGNRDPLTMCKATCANQRTYCVDNCTDAKCKAGCNSALKDCQNKCQTNPQGSNYCPAGATNCFVTGPGTGVKRVQTTSTPTPVANATPTPVPFLARSIPQRCNANCAEDTECGEGMVCVQKTVVGTDGKETVVGACRNAQCYGVDDCWCYKSMTPTPGSKCDSGCTSDADCAPSFICVQTGLKTAANPNPYNCRNPLCYGVGSEANCLCYSTLTTPTPTGGVELTLFATPTPFSYETGLNPARTTSTYLGNPTPAPLSDILLADLLTPTPNPLLSSLKASAPILTIFPFYDAKKQTNPTFLLTGTSDPDAELSLSIFPDGVTATIKADALGNWQYPMTQKLSNGAKQLTMIARSQSGGQMTKTEAFSVVGAYQIPFAAIVFGVLLVAGVGGYLFFMNKKNKKPGSPPVGPYIPTTPPDFQQPQSSPVEGYNTTKPDAPSPYGFEVPRHISPTGAPQSPENAVSPDGSSVDTPPSLSDQPKIS